MKSALNGLAPCCVDFVASLTLMGLDETLILAARYLKSGHDGCWMVIIIKS